jgi:hypothetical protein
MIYDENLPSGDTDSVQIPSSQPLVFFVTFLGHLFDVLSLTAPEKTRLLRVAVNSVGNYLVCLMINDKNPSSGSTYSSLFSTTNF